MRGLQQDAPSRKVSPQRLFFLPASAGDERPHPVASQGSYGSEELTSLRSDDITYPVYLNITKPTGSPVYNIQCFERWPVILKSGKSVKYSGKEINDRDFAGSDLL